jgi:hypothetical protein
VLAYVNSPPAPRDNDGRGDGTDQVAQNCYDSYGKNSNHGLQGRKTQSELQQRSTRLPEAVEMTFEGQGKPDFLQALPYPEEKSGKLEIVTSGDLDIGRIPMNKPDRDPQMLNQRSIVGSLNALPFRMVVRFLKDIETECLRSLDNPDS